MRPLIFFTCFVVRDRVKSCCGVEKRVEIRTFWTKGFVLQNRVSWGASVSAAKSGLSEPKAGAAVEIRRTKGRMSEFRAPQTGESFCPCQRKHRKTLIYKVFRCFFVSHSFTEIYSQNRLFSLDFTYFVVKSWSKSGSKSGSKKWSKNGKKKRRKTH